MPDFVGQQNLERVYQVILVLAGCIGCIVGYISRDLYLAVLIIGGGFGVASLLVVPDWPFWNLNHLKWQSAVAAEEITCLSPEQLQPAVELETKSTEKIIAKKNK